MSDPAGFDLQRFVRAQEPVFVQVLDELTKGRKCSHWMWFIFPQLRGLGRSPAAQRFGIASKVEARAFLDHHLLGPRLILCTEMLMTHTDKSLIEILGSPDDLKFRSSMTLFAKVDPNPMPFLQALDRYCGGRMDPQTLALLEGH
ncbi:DUF1810 domain-containing protein [Phyllobacterium endophyticum]|uniref:DUF1810 domain-containing protein n=1 Tax=Phyllobacterium endophyticum TaxID=1149773 RepID=A0A2P7AUC2_9HYPH|nr:DUF1810 domain-containing protein [Phyllobacterium endophyticum]MBB3234283.1 uncharacterized protein (DUF1810 family) [Phyllobacterium endophyticum]PSH57822.1 DUF1810 domain-containing protein [Phyllobacterium endophyticum]TYR44026.1 DUF1810 domain-containing protein [Phyllobacterium endophyticum]